MTNIATTAPSPVGLNSNIASMTDITIVSTTQ
jgi:hypothetical protein